MLRVGLIGCGTIGTQLARALEQRYARSVRLTALHDSDRSHAEALRRQLRRPPPIVSLPQVIRRSHLVVEAASVSIAADVATRALRANRQVIIMSVGGLLRNRRWRAAASRSRGRLFIPSGALAGLDGVKALAVGRIRAVSLTTRKPPRALQGAPGLARRGRRLLRLAKPTVVFRGSPRAVVKAFPQNTNIAAAVTLASGLPDTVPRIRVVADPAATRNTHELEVVGDCGRLRCLITSRPSANPKTSEVAVRSAIAMIGRLVDPIVIGT